MLKNFIKAGLVTIPLTGVIDQLSKQIVLNNLHPPKSIPITSFFELLLTFNKGISFGLFAADKMIGKIMLLLLAAGLVSWLLVCLWKAPTKLESISFGLIIGGAIGNMIDRIFYGAVVDFLHFHLFNYSFPVFNIADSAITIGVGLILLQQAWHFIKNKQVA